MDITIDCDSANISAASHRVRAYLNEIDTYDLFNAIGIQDLITHLGVNEVLGNIEFSDIISFLEDNDYKITKE